VRRFDGKYWHVNFCLELAATRLKVLVNAVESMGRCNARLRIE